MRLKSVSGFRRISGQRFATELIVKKRTRTEVSLELHEEVAVRAHRISMADCPDCGGEMRMIPANEAAMIAKITARELYSRVSTGELHFTEDRLGLLYICAESLRNLLTAEARDMAKAANRDE